MLNIHLQIINVWESHEPKAYVFLVHKEREKAPTNKDEEIDPSFYYTRFKKLYI
jgi:hypothetical protein